MLTLVGMGTPSVLIIPLLGQPDSPNLGYLRNITNDKFCILKKLRLTQNESKLTMEGPVIRERGFLQCKVPIL